jgi:hypothetical protein
MPLDDEVEKAQRLVRTDSYGMSIGEIVNMYEEEELVIRPPFQRLFRWDTQQKSKLVESILLGIPIPPIFVFETPKGQWELIDGLQRISTILEFMGLLRNEDTDRLLSPSYLEGTRYLPSLRNAVWERNDKIHEISEKDQRPFAKTQQFAFKRAKLNVQILKRPSDAHTKYDLFQRLNRGGTPANSQEIRNCVVIMVNNGFFDILKDLSEDSGYLRIAGITEAGLQAQRPLELVMRFFVLSSFNYDGELDVEEFIDENIIALAEKSPPKAELSNLFKDTFGLLRSSLGDDALRRYDANSSTFGGRVGQVALEVIAVGVARNLARIKKVSNPETFVEGRVKEFWQEEIANEFTRSGVRGTDRLMQTVPFGERWFRP